jgi:hypothetical protein
LRWNRWAADFKPTGSSADGFFSDIISNGLGDLHFPRQSFSGDVQPALDRTDRRVEGVAHLQQRLASQIEGL